MVKVFVSYAGEDSALADEVHGWLRGEGHQVFLDRHPQDGIDVGDDWEQRLYERLQWSDAVLCLITAAYLRSVWCSAELGIARSLGCRLLPVRGEPGAIHPLLHSVQVLDHGPACRDQIAVTLRRIDAGGATGWTYRLNPYPGLRPFDADLHRVFFGRDQESEKLAEMLRSPAARSTGMTLVIGPSGCGKSSLLRAGLVPLLRAEPGWWTLPVFVPGPDPVQALAREVTTAARRIGLDWTVVSVRERLDSERGLAEPAEELLVAAPGGPHHSPLVVVDQVEEVLSLSAQAVG